MLKVARIRLNKAEGEAIAALAWDRIVSATTARETCWSVWPHYSRENSALCFVLVGTPKHVLCDQR